MRSRPRGGALRSPPLDPLRSVVRTLEREGATCALGGSGLLMALGLGQAAGDWDLTTEAPLERVLETLRAFEPVIAGPQGVHADTKLQLRDGEIEVIVGLALRSGVSVVRLPNLVTGRWKGVPLGSPEVWAAAYQLLGRAEKSALLFGLLERGGADPGVLARLLGEPLPQDLRDRLGRLPRRAPSRDT